MRGGVQPRLLCVVIVLSVVLSGFLAAASAADPSDASASPAADPALPGDGRLPKAAPKAASIDREGLRVWSERLGLPKATLAYVPDDRSGLVYEVGGGSAITPARPGEAAIQPAGRA